MGQLGKLVKIRPDFHIVTPNRSPDQAPVTQSSAELILND